MRLYLLLRFFGRKVEKPWFMQYSNLFPNLSSPILTRSGYEHMHILLGDFMPSAHFHAEQSQNERPLGCCLQRIVFERIP